MAEAASAISAMMDAGEVLGPADTDPAPPARRDPAGRFAKARAAANIRAAEYSSDRADDAPPDEDEEAEAPASEDEEAVEAAPEGDADAEQPAADAEAAESGGTALAEVAEQFGVDEAGFLAAVELAGPDGKKVPLAQVVEQWRKGGASPAPDPAFEQRARAVAEREAAIRQREELGLGQLRALTEQLIATMEAEPQVDLEKLKESGDVVGYIEAQERARKRQDALANSIARLRRAEAERSQAAVEAEQRMVAEQAAWAKQVMPEWADEAKGRAAMDQVMRWLKSAGPGRPFDERELAQITDGRYIITAWKAAEYDRLQASKPAALKKLNGLPKPLRPGSAAPRADLNAQRDTKALRQRLRRSGTLQDAARLIGRMEI